MSAATGIFAVLVLVFLVVGLAGTVFWLWALVDVLRRPDQQYTAAGQNKVLWLLVVLLGHFIGALIYLLLARPQLERVAAPRY
jgi:Phospholipase_D-nuclease N-terminal/Protein of unknown function (DUF2516)